MAYLEISKKAYLHNLAILQKICNKNNLDLNIVLKDNAYGHSISLLAPIASKFGVKYASCKNTSEALKINNLFTEVLAFYGNASDYNSSCIGSNISLSVHDLNTLKALQSGAKVELKINIGLNRNGIEISDFSTAIDLILQNDLNLRGIFTHFAHADGDSEQFFTDLNQWEEFKTQALVALENKNIKNIKIHSLNSSGLFRLDENNLKTTDNSARIGGASYGYKLYKKEDSLKIIAKLYANKIATHYLKRGERIGYDGISLLGNDAIISSYDIGYGDGLMRITQEGLKIASGEAILPKSSMDCISVKDCQKDKICVFDDARVLANFYKTIPYEITTNLSANLPRILVP